jgi:hypothetical protein
MSSPSGAGPERDRRVVVAHLPVDEVVLAGRDVGRVADDQVDAAIELGQRVAGIRTVEDDARAGEVAARPVDRVGVDLDGVDTGRRTSVAIAGRDRPAARAEVDDETCGDRITAQHVDGPACDDLGLGSGDEDARPDHQLEMTEADPADEVLQRDARGPAVDEAGELAGAFGRQHRHGRERGRGGRQDVRASCSASARGDGTPAAASRSVASAEHGPQGQLAHSLAESRAASSASISASMTPSSSPSSTASRLYAL